MHARPSLRFASLTAASRPDTPQAGEPKTRKTWMARMPRTAWTALAREAKTRAALRVHAGPDHRDLA